MIFGWCLDDFWMMFGWFLDDVWMMFGWFLDDVWMMFGWFLDDVWMMFGWFLDDFWMIFGWFLDDVWMMFGWFLDDVWMMFGWFLDDFWMIFGWFLDCVWMIFGWFLDYVWMIFGWFLDDFWMICEWFLDDFWMILEPHFCTEQNGETNHWSPFHSSPFCRAKPLLGAHGCLSHVDQKRVCLDLCLPRNGDINWYNTAISTMAIPMNQIPHKPHPSTKPQGFAAHCSAAPAKVYRWDSPFCRAALADWTSVAATGPHGSSMTGSQSLWVANSELDCNTSAFGIWEILIFHLILILNRSRSSSQMIHRFSLIFYPQILTGPGIFT